MALFICLIGQTQKKLTYAIIEKQKFYGEFGVTVADVFGNAIEKLKGWKLLEEDSERLWLTEYGLDVSNVAFQEFLLEDVE